MILLLIWNSDNCQHLIKHLRTNRKDTMFNKPNITLNLTYNDDFIFICFIFVTVMLIIIFHFTHEHRSARMLNNKFMSSLQMRHPALQLANIPSNSTKVSIFCFCFV